MKTGRNILIGAVLALSSGSAILAPGATPAVAASGSHVHVTAMSAVPNTFYHG